MKKQKQISAEEAVQKMYRYCAYQERCHQEVKNKLYEFGLNTTAVNEVISQLITEGFLNEERFAKAYAGGKFRMKQWGRLKIVNALEGKGLTKNCIASGLKEIDIITYEEVLDALLQKKNSQFTDESNDFQRRDKVATYVIQKGFEPDLVWTRIKALKL